MTLDNEGVRVEEARTCFLCKLPGQMLYGALRDRLFRAPGAWSLLKCGGCGLVWLDPQPVPEDIGKLYAQYYTHGQEPSAVSSLPANASLRDKVLRSVLAAHLGYPLVPSSRAWERIGKIGRLVALLRDWAGGAVMNLPAAARGRLLDIGCGGGGFLAAMRDRGWQVQGVEPDPEAARLARERYGLEVFTGTLEEALRLLDGKMGEERVLIATSSG
jgi:SAM-dependent methyltransferase